MEKGCHLEVGTAGEEAAVRFLRARGWRILARNWRPAGPARGLELDVIARHGEALVFVEVKTRSRAPARDGAHADAADPIPAHASFTWKKQARLVEAARRYLSCNGLWHLPCRFDLICVEQRPGGPLKLEHYSDVIKLGHIVDSGNSPWQPW